MLFKPEEVCALEAIKSKTQALTKLDAQPWRLE